jgi:hypothetical protein
MNICGFIKEFVQKENGSVLSEIGRITKNKARTRKNINEINHIVFLLNEFLSKKE